MTLDEYVATLSPTHTFYLDGMRETAKANNDPLPADFDLLMEVDRRARIDMWFQARYNGPLDYCNPDPHLEGVYLVILSDTYEVLVVKLEDDLVTLAGDPV